MLGFLSLSSLAALALAGLAAGRAISDPVARDAPRSAAMAKRWYPISPKVFIISMFGPEDLWTSALDLNQNITLPGLSPLYPNVTCDSEGSVCHVITGEAEINAACTMTAVLFSSDFDFTSTYFMIIGIAGINPFEGTLGSVGIARYAVQVALAYELDARQIPSNWTTGYWLFGTSQPGEVATTIYGTEVFELNTNLRAAVFKYTEGVELNDTSAAAAYRANYDYAPANAPPKVFYGDVATSDVYFAGSLLSEAFGNITKLWTNNTGHYALTAQEDNASLEAMLRADKAGLMDLSRVILIRTASDFDRAPPDQSTVYSFEIDQGGFDPAIANILIAGQPIVEGILNDWNSTFSAGIAPQSDWLYSSDDLHTLTDMRKREVAQFKQVQKRSRSMRV